MDEKKFRRSLNTANEVHPAYPLRQEREYTRTAAGQTDLPCPTLTQSVAKRFEVRAPATERGLERIAEAHRSFGNYSLSPKDLRGS